MKIIKQGFELLTPIDGENIMRAIERSARLCYKSEGNTNEGSADKLVASLIKRGYHATLEHASLSVRFVTNRGVTHELVRHRVASFAQESTRYCNYSSGKFGNQCTFIQPVWFDNNILGRLVSNQLTERELIWYESMSYSEQSYFKDLENGATAQEAREILPNSLKTEIDVTCNIREWRHIMSLRVAKAAHPQMRALMIPLLELFKAEMPILFSDIESENK